jgi:hypothetical protein
MKITSKWLRSKNACADGYKWFLYQHINDSMKIIERLIAQDHYEWANWLIVRVMTREEYISYAIYSAE